MEQEPLCQEYPSVQDLKQTSSLKDALTAEDIIETHEGYEQRKMVIATLNRFIKMWLHSHCQTKMGMSEETAHLVNAKLFTFGSFRLGVHSRNCAVLICLPKYLQDGDIDALICFPRSVSREDFFYSFYDALAQRDDVEELHSAESAAVPAIKLKFGGVEMDILMAQLSADSISPKLDLSDDEILRDLSVACVRSVNGCRVTDKIIELCPALRDDFGYCLRAIKLWAKRRGIYSNALGYLGGVHLAILVAKICQLFPNATASTLVEKFFWCYNQWDWSNPIKLREVPDLHMSHVTHWEPLHDPYDTSVMKIMTPVYPAQNASFSVVKSTLYRIQKEIDRAELLMKKIRSGKAPWKRLWKEISLFGTFAYYVMVQATAVSEADRTLYEGLVESTIRVLVTQLESHEAVSYAVPIPKAFRRVPSVSLEATVESTDNESPIKFDSCWRTVWFIGLIFNDKPCASLDIMSVMDEFQRKIEYKEKRMSRYKPTMRYSVDPIPREELPSWVFPENTSTKRPATRVCQPVQPAKRAPAAKSENETTAETVCSEAETTETGKNNRSNTSEPKAAFVNLDTELINETKELKSDEAQGESCLKAKTPPNTNSEDDAELKVDVTVQESVTSYKGDPKTDPHVAPNGSDSTEAEETRASHNHFSESIVSDVAQQSIQAPKDGVESDQPIEVTAEQGDDTSKTVSNPESDTQTSHLSASQTVPQEHHRNIHHALKPDSNEPVPEIDLDVGMAPATTTTTSSAAVDPPRVVVKLHSKGKVSGRSNHRSANSSANSNGKRRR